MASKYGRAGKSTREMAERRSLIRASFGLVAIVLMWVFLTVLRHAQGMGIGAIVVLFLTYKTAMNFLEVKIDTKIKEEKRAIRGAKAEEKLEEILNQFGADTLVLHDVPSPNGNIDHIVLSKANGVFLIETKAHGGNVAADDSRLLVNGKSPEKDFIAQTLRNTYWLRDEIKSVTDADVWINSMIVFTNAFVESCRPIKGITITNKKFVLRTIQRNRKPMSMPLWNAREKIAERLSCLAEAPASF
jgi:hypothetical protein